MNVEALSELSNEELLSNLLAVVGDGRRLLANLLAYLGEVEVRHLHLEAACSSLFDYCVHRLGMSGGEAFRRPEPIVSIETVIREALAILT